MPYQETQPMLVTFVGEAGSRASARTFLPENGTYLRSLNGDLIGKIPEGEQPVMYARFDEVGGEKLMGVIKDPLLKSRLLEYLDQYLGKKYTNCSAFAHFLFTGEFIECEEENNLTVVRHHMQQYRNVQRVHIGDMLCVIHVRQRFAQSRRTGWRNNYLKVKKSRNDKGACLTRSLRTEEQVLSPEEILEFCKSPLMVDYHFMVCVDIKNGKPVWLSQLGRDDGKEELAPLAITHGNEDLRPNEVPLLTLIKRRK
jgi:hypothetical protein